MLDDLLRQLAVLRRIDKVNPVTQHRNRAPARVERSLVRRRVNPARQPAHNRHAAARQVADQ